MIRFTIMARIMRLFRRLVRSIQNLMRDMEKMSGVRKEPTRSGNILAVQM